MKKGLRKNNSIKPPCNKTVVNKMFAGAQPLLFKLAAELRSHQTHAEELLWHYLKAKPLGFKFRRQHPFLIYILDFYCHALQLVIEVDGSIHNQEEVKQKDEIRQKHLAEHGLTILRFVNADVEHKHEEVINQIEHHLARSTRPLTEMSLPPKSPL